MGAKHMKQFNKQATTLLLAAGMGLAATARVGRQPAGCAEGARPEPAGSAGGGEDLCADRQARRLRRLQLGRPVRPGHRLWRALDAHPEVHRRVHARTLAGLRLRRKLEEGAGQGRIDGKDITWGDTHHPAISETNGEYDGQFLFINDKANPRLAVIDLRDFETKQIVVNPIFKSEHGGAFVSPTPST
jgi:hypothetical protein